MIRSRFGADVSCRHLCEEHNLFTVRFFVASPFDSRLANRELDFPERVAVAGDSRADVEEEAHRGRLLMNAETRGAHRGVARTRDDHHCAPSGKFTKRVEKTAQPPSANGGDRSPIRLPRNARNEIHAWHGACDLAGYTVQGRHEPAGRRPPKREWRPSHGAPETARR